MRTKKEIKQMLNSIEADLSLQKLTLHVSGHFSKSNKKQLKKFIEDLQNEIDILEWVLNKPSNLPF